MTIYISTGTIAHDDRGFRYGDGVFETIRIEAGRALAWPKHIERLQAGLDALAIPFDAKTLTEKAKEVWASGGLPSGFLRIAISRGAGSAGYLPTGSTPTVVMECLPPAKPCESLTLAVSQYEKISPKALPTHVKTAQGLQSTLARMEAKSKGVDDVVLLSASGCVSETSSANLFWLKDGALYTPSLATGALAGVMRASVLEACSMPVHEGAYPLAHMLAAELIFATNVRMGLCPVAQFENQRFSAAHPALSLVYDAVQQRINLLTW
jgi:branched-chain amino acid aminotransferase